MMASLTGWFLGVALSGLALPGVALAGTLPAPAPAVSTNDDPHAAGASPAPTAVPPAPTASPAAPAPATPGLGASAPPLSSPPSPVPAPPPGYYAYPPAGYPSPPPSYFAAQRLAVLDAQIRDLQIRRDDISLELPLALLIGGGVVGIVGLAVLGASTCDTDQYGNRQDPTCVENRGGIDRGAALLIAGGLGVAFGGTSLIIRTARRRHIARQIEARQVEANVLRTFAAPRWGVRPFSTGGGVVSLALDF
jgi:hypothetical protein